jgi:hypothetical protein
MTSKNGTQEHTVATAASTGTHLDLLKAMRDRIALEAADPACAARDLAALTNRLQGIAKDIVAIEERLTQDARESNPCKHCDGTGVSRDSRGGASNNDDWQPE